MNLSMCNAMLAMVLASAAGATEPHDVVMDLGWLAGNWVRVEGHHYTAEIWSRPVGGMLFGHGQVTDMGRTVSFEEMRIEATETEVFYIVRSAGEGETRARLVTVDGQHLVFEAPEHDYPQRISYRRDGDQLTVHIEMLDGRDGRTRTWRLWR